ncbi:MAG: hypothetical protein HQ510_06315 [Candidatus Marinimicrobia bacterium]|nr:hypothetical protein [Candidatus Neomarinimicrobiota bacterium]
MKFEQFKYLGIILLFSISVLFSETEIVGKRSIFTKTFQIDSTEYKIDIYNSPIHYLNESDEFIEIPQNSEETDSLIQLARSVSGTPADIYGLVGYSPSGSYQGNYGLWDPQWPVVGNAMLDSWNAGIFPPSSWLSRGYMYFNLEEVYNIYEEFSNFEIQNAGFYFTTSDNQNLGQDINVTLLPYVSDSGFDGYENGDAQTIWNLIENSDEVGSIDSYGYPYIAHYPDDNISPNLVTSLQDAIDSDEVFIGIGMMGSDEDDLFDGYYHYTRYNSMNQYFSIEYQVLEVVMKNISSTNQNLGGTLSLENLTTEDVTTVSSNSDPIPINLTDHYTATTFDPILGSTNKHHSWNSQSNYLLDWEDFLINQVYITEDIKAKFWDFQEIEIISDLPSDLEFYDPWYTYEDPVSEEWIQPDDLLTVDEQLNTNSKLDVFPDQNENFVPGLLSYLISAPLFYKDETTGINYIFDQWKAYNSSDQDITSSQIFEDSQAVETKIVFSDQTAKVEAFYHELTFTNSNCEITLNQNDELILTAPGLIDNTTDYDVFNDWIVVSGTCTISDDESPTTELTSISSDVELNIDYYENTVIDGGTMTDYQTVVSEDNYYLSSGGLYLINGLSVDSGTATWEDDSGGFIGSYVLTSDQGTYDLTNTFTVTIGSDNVEISRDYLNLMDYVGSYFNLLFNSWR